MASGTLTILGCGGSAGVPAIGNWWGNCDPAEPKNRRTRPSIALQTEDALVVVDTGADFREQMNREKLGRPDAVVITHVHADHVSGIDELRYMQRIFKIKELYPLYAFPDTMDKLMDKYDYMFMETEGGFYPAVCNPVRVEEGDEIKIGSLRATVFSQVHGSIRSLGLRIGNVAYSTDVLRLDDTAYEILKGIDTWVLDGAAYNSPPTVHVGLKEVYAMNERVGAKKVYITHMSPMMDYATLRKELPAGYEPAYDGLKINFTL